MIKLMFYMFLVSIILNISFVNASGHYINPAKMGDYVNLGIVLVPYGLKLIKLSTKDLQPKEFVRKLFSVKMITYLIGMFITQKFLWQYGSPGMRNYFSPSEFSLKSTTAWVLFGGLVGITSLMTGSFIAGKINSSLKKQEK